MTKKQKWTVCLTVSAEKYITVEAETEAEAMQLAEESDENSFEICHMCSDTFELDSHQGKAVCADEEE